MTDFLDKILAHKKAHNKEKAEYFVKIKEQLDKSEYSRYGIFKKCISGAEKINLIAEIKKASPSRGLIRDDFDVGDIARIYSECKADAVSILTEDKYFLGKPAYIKKINEKYDLPILAKDFFIDEGQIYEARINGASAILLIVAILDEGMIKNFMEVASSLDLDCLVETHDQEELEVALKCGAEIVGVNSRNLKTFEVDINNGAKLISQIPKEKVIIAESGIKTFDDVSMLQEAGANAVLIGETFMKEKDIAKKVKEVMNYES